MSRFRLRTKTAQLNRVERQLVEHVGRGMELDLLDGVPCETVTMRSWDATHKIRAEVIRELLLGGLTDADPPGVRLRGG